MLADIEGCSYEEIGKIVGCAVGTVRSRLHRARDTPAWPRYTLYEVIVMNETHPSIEQLVDYLHGELPPPKTLRSTRTSRHARVLGARNEEAALTDLLRAHARAKDASCRRADGVIAKIRESAHGEPSWWELCDRIPPGPARSVAAAASLVIFLRIFSATHRPARATSIDAALLRRQHAASPAAAPFAQDAYRPRC